jgi:hypothetical protein
MPTVKCAICNHENVVSARFCNGCGRPLTAACKLCDADNPIGAVFCQNCGTELAGLRPGLTLQQLAAWRSAFERIGWVQWRQFGRDDLDLIATGGFSMNVDDSEEPWVFGCKADGKDYKPAYLAVREPDRKRIFYAAGNWMEKNKGIVVATRCRIALFGTKSRQVFSWLYSDIKEFASGYGMGLLTLVLWHSQGNLMEINFTVPEGGVLDRLIVATASDTPTGGLAIAGAANRATTRADNKVEFKEAVEQFVRSAGVARRQISNATNR